jgi:hypothetical protein
LTALLLCDPLFHGPLATAELQVQVISLGPDGRSSQIAFESGWKEVDESVDEDSSSWRAIPPHNLEYFRTADGFVSGIRVTDFDFYWHKRNTRQNDCKR